jgi:hypothetical protein
MESQAKTKEDAVVIEANRELTPPSCSPRICPRSSPVHPTTIPRMLPNSLRGGTAGASGDWCDVYADVGTGPAWSEWFNRVG